jgi:hypothetical protein
MTIVLASAVAWNLSKQTCGILQNYVMLLDLDFMPSDQIGHMSLNGLRRQVATIDKTQIGTRMHEPSVELDPEYLVSAIGAPTLSFYQPKKNLLEYLQH